VVRWAKSPRAEAFALTLVKEVRHNDQTGMSPVWPTEVEEMMVDRKWLAAISITSVVFATAAGTVRAELNPASDLASKDAGASELAAKDGGAFELAAKDGGAFELATKDGGAFELAAKDGGAFELSAKDSGAFELSAKDGGIVELGAREGGGGGWLK
jgi:hypothetical protein